MTYARWPWWLLNALVFGMGAGTAYLAFYTSQIWSMLSAGITIGFAISITMTELTVRLAHRRAARDFPLRTEAVTTEAYSRATYAGVVQGLTRLQDEGHLPIGEYLIQRVNQDDNRPPT